MSLNRPGHNYLLGKNGRVTYHGKSFAPEEARAGDTHVTVFPGGKYRVNEGVMTPAKLSVLKEALKR